MSNEEDARKNKAIEQAEILLRGLRTGQIHSFIAAAVGNDNDETYYSGDLMGKHVGTRLIGIMTIAIAKISGRFAASDYDRGPKSIGPKGSE